MWNAYRAQVIFNIGDFQNKSGEDFVVQDFEQEEHVFQTARRMSAPSEIHHGSPAKGT